MLFVNKVACISVLMLSNEVGILFIVAVFKCGSQAQTFIHLVNEYALLEVI